MNITYAQMSHKFDQENTIECVKRVKNYVDRIIIVHDTIDESTVKCLEDYGAEVYKEKWFDNFSAYRNKYVRKIRIGDWALVTDPDEYPSIVLLENLRKIIDIAEKESYGIVRVPVEDHFEHKDGRYTVTRSGNWFKPMMFKKYERVAYRGLVHETIATENNKELVAPPDCVYEHHRSWWRVGRAGVRNDFCGESNRESKEYWVPMRRMFAKHAIRTWYQLEEYLKKGDIAPEIESWIISGKDRSDHEFKDWHIFFHEFLFENRCKNDSRCKNHKSLAI